MTPQEEVNFKQRVQASLTQAFQSPHIGFSITSYKEIAPNFYNVEISLNFQMRGYALVYDHGSSCNVFLEAGTIYSFILQPVLQRYSREHPWLLGV